MYRLKVDHVYQRRFDSRDLAVALQHSHWYIITRRPSVRLVPGSVRIDEKILSAGFITRAGFEKPERTYSLASDFQLMEELHDFEMYEAGAYFSVGVGERIMHGDAWALASLLSTADIELARQEVLYIGQAFGHGGSSNAWQRTQNHQKLQRIYEDHVNADCEIFVAPLSLERSSFVSDDHIDDSEDGPSMDKYHQAFSSLEGKIKKTSVDLVEHGLIAYFAPPYNEKLTEWHAENPTNAMEKMRWAGFRLLQLHLSGWWGIARFYSEREPKPVRTHFISHDIPPWPHRLVARGIAAERVSEWRLGSRLIREGPRLLDEKTEKTGVSLRIFGDEAPMIRKPPTVVLPRYPSFADSTSEGDESAREAIKKARQNRHRPRESALSNGKSSYDVDAGTIKVGQYEDGESTHLRLDEPATGRVSSTLIYGDPGSGKSNVLRIISLDALLSRRFWIIPADPTGRNEYGRLWKGAVHSDKFICTDLNGTISGLILMRRVMNERLSGGYELCPRTVSQILFAIDDADVALRHPLGAKIAVEILAQGSPVGLGMLIAVSDILALRDNRPLMKQLIHCDNVLSLMSDGNYVTDDLRARYGTQRMATYIGDNTSFVLHLMPETACVGILVGIAEAAASLEEVQNFWAQSFAADSRFVIQWEQIEDDPSSWLTIDPLPATSWVIRRHQDVWAVIRILASLSWDCFPWIPRANSVG